eukprot:SAG11_NODE_56_length_19295_cov_20.219675_14_plen_148_part_00
MRDRKSGAKKLVESPADQWCEYCNTKRSTIERKKNEMFRADQEKGLGRSAFRKIGGAWVCQVHRRKRERAMEAKLKKAMEAAQPSPQKAMKTTWADLPTKKSQLVALAYEFEKLQSAMQEFQATHNDRMRRNDNVRQCFSEPLFLGG